jgi:hypothetical protein
MYTDACAKVNHDSHHPRRYNQIRSSTPVQYKQNILKSTPDQLNLTRKWVISTGGPRQQQSNYIPWRPGTSTWLKMVMVRHERRWLCPDSWAYRQSSILITEPVPSNRMDFDPTNELVASAKTYGLRHVGNEFVPQLAKRISHQVHGEITPQNWVFFDKIQLAESVWIVWIWCHNHAPNTHSLLTGPERIQLPQSASSAVVVAVVVPASTSTNVN